MKICFIGLGSIAKRHISNILDIYGDKTEIDILRSGNNKSIPEILQRHNLNVVYQENELKYKYDAVFITNPTKMHYDTLLKFNEKSNCFFIEKPIFEFGEEDISVFNKSKIYYTACPLRYTNVIQYLKHNVDFDKVYSIRAISSSYLPDWRPGTDYRDTYSAHKDMGGGVSIDLIHEWDYICYLVGLPNQVKSFVKQKSNLEIDSDDIAIYIADYPDKTVEIHLDYFGRKSLRYVELMTEDDTIRADLINQKIEFLNNGESIDLSQERNDYQKRELQHFFDICNGRYQNDNTIEEACEILKITRGER